MTTNQLDIRASPEEVFEVLADGWSYAAWVVGAKEILDVEPDFPAPGSRFRNRVRDGLRGIEGTTSVLEVDRPRTLRLLAQVRRVGDADICFRLEPIATGTHVTMHEQPVGDRPGALIGRRSGALLRIRNAETLWRLKSVVEERAGHARVETSVGTPSIPGPLGTLTARAFAALAVLRGKRGLHPRGEVLYGTASFHAAGAALARTEHVAVAVRLSRGIGLPHPLPDFNGVAVRFLDAHGTGRHQDLLLTAAFRRPVLRHLIHPSRSFRHAGFSSVLPYRDERGSLRLFWCDPVPVASLGELAGALPFEVQLRAGSLLGPWEPAATLTLHEVASEAPGGIRFDPWHTTTALTPAGLLNRLRAPAYAASRATARL